MKLDRTADILRLRNPVMRSAWAALLLVACVTSAWAGIGGGEGPEPPSLGTGLRAVPSPLPAPGKGLLRLEIRVPSGFHIFSDDTLGVKLPSFEGVSYGTPVVPRGKMEEDRPVLRGTVVVQIPVTLAKGAPALLKGALSLDWQACQEFGDKVCFLPTTDSVPFELKTAPARETAAAAAQPAPATPPAPPPSSVSAGDVGPGVMSTTPPEDAGYEARFTRAAKENVPLALLLAFLFGLLSSLTPCVYPVIPITVAYIGSRSEGRGRSAGFFLSLAFVAGLAIVYAVLGAVSATAGSAFGSLTQTPWVGVPIALLFFALSLSMFNLFEFKTPAALTNRIEATKQKGKGRGFLGAFLIGALSGLVASPCIGPLILAILVVVAATGSVVLGFLYLFVFALGMGVLFVVIGTFSGVLASLPKSGGWMDGVRVLFGSLILAAAFYFAGLYLPRQVFLTASLLALWTVVLFLLFGAKRHFFTIPLRVAGIVLCSGALALVFLLLPAAGGGPTGPWQSDLGKAARTASVQGRPMLLDFRADWCVACVELEKKTWPDKGVEAVLGDLVPVRLDMTKSTAANQVLLKRYGIVGLPTVLLLDKDGKERGRFAGFKSPEEFLAWYKGVSGKT